MLRFVMSKKGFSMMELIATLVIIAVLIGIAIPIYRSKAEKGRITVCQENQRLLKSQLNTFFMTNKDVKWSGVKWNGKGKPNDGNYRLRIVHNRDGSHSWYSAPDGFPAMFNETDPPVCPVKGNAILCVYTLTVSGRIDSCQTECLTPKNDSDTYGTNYNSTHSIDASF